MRIIVTGADGFLGRHVAPRLRAAGWDVRVPTHREVDLCDPAATRRLVDGVAPDTVVHLAAACGGIGLNQARPATLLRLNALMGLSVLEACAAAGVRRLVMLGTTCAYPRDCPTPFVEEAIFDGYPEPTNAPYAIAKRMLLVAAQAYRRERALDAVTLIPTNLYGPEDHFDLDRSHVVPAMIARMADRLRRACELRAQHGDAAVGADLVTLWGDGTPTRDLLYVEDCADAVVRAVQEPDLGPEPVNLGSGVETSMTELAQRVAAAVGYDGKILWDATKPNGQPRRLLDTTRARLRLGWRATTPLAEGLRRTVAWWRDTGGRP